MFENIWTPLLAQGDAQRRNLEAAVKTLKRRISPPPPRNRLSIQASKALEYARPSNGGGADRDRTGLAGISLL